jgi:hypothetical protein
MNRFQNLMAEMTAADATSASTRDQLYRFLMDLEAALNLRAIGLNAQEKDLAEGQALLARQREDFARETVEFSQREAAVAKREEKVQKIELVWDGILAALDKVSGGVADLAVGVQLFNEATIEPEPAAEPVLEAAPPIKAAPDTFPAPMAEPELPASEPAPVLAVLDLIDQHNDAAAAAVGAPLELAPTPQPAPEPAPEPVLVAATEPKPAPLPEPVLASVAGL